MKILILNVNAHEASTGKIVYGLYKFLMNNGADVRLCYRGINEVKMHNDNIVPLSNMFLCGISALLSRFIGYEGLYSHIPTFKLKRIIEKFKPDIVHLFNLPGYYVNHYSLLEYLKKKEIPTVLSMMDEFPYTAKCCFAFDCEKFKSECKKCPQKEAYPESYIFDWSNVIFNRKKKIYEGFNRLILTGVEWSCKMAKESALTRNCQLKIIPHPINTETLFYPRIADDLRTQLNITKDKIVILTATSAKHIRKGAKYFFDLAWNMLSNDKYLFLFVGYDRNDWEIPSNMITVGYVRDQSKLAEYYSLADFYICTSIADTFPTTCLNALACGTPIAGFIAGGVPYCAPSPYGKYVKIGDVEGLSQIVSSVDHKSKKIIEDTRKYAVDHYSEEVVNSKFLKVYNELLSLK